MTRRLPLQQQTHKYIQIHYAALILWLTHSPALSLSLHHSVCFYFLAAAPTPLLLFAFFPRFLLLFLFISQAIYLCYVFSVKCHVKNRSTDDFSTRFTAVSILMTWFLFFLRWRSRTESPCSPWPLPPPSTDTEWAGVRDPSVIYTFFLVQLFAVHFF